jgi:5-methylcytosine-specific restriction endonuclease McrA
MAFPQSVIDDLWRRAAMRCECTRTTHDHSGRCTRPLSAGQWHAHHVTSVAAGGSDTLANGEALCVPCHEKTRSFGG